MNNIYLKNMQKFIKSQAKFRCQVLT